MANIAPVTVWHQGEQQTANVFNLYSIGDNLIDSAQFKYQLIKEVVVDEQTNSQTLLTGELFINSVEYAEWDLEADANAWIYNWAASKLNLTII